MSEKVSIGRIVQIQVNVAAVEPDDEAWRPAIVVEVLNEKQGIITATIFLTQEDGRGYGLPGSNESNISLFKPGQHTVRHTRIYPGDGFNQWRWPPRVPAKGYWGPA